MTTQQTSSPTPDAPRSSWKGKAIAVAVSVLALVITYIVLAAVAPRWWSLRMGELAGQTFHRGIGWGLTFGVVCTLVPLLLLYAAFAGRKTRARGPIAIISAVAAIIVAAPNLLTLSIVAGTGSAAHAGERVLDTEAPGFRGATLAGAIIALLLFVAMVFFIARARRRRALKKATRAAAEAS